MTPEQEQAILDALRKAAIAEATKAMEAKNGSPARQSGEVIATTDDGGRVTRGADGKLSFASPAYSTNDPDAIARIMEGASPAQESRNSFYEGAIDQHPIAARGAKFVQGIPFVGEYADEAIGTAAGPEAMSAVRNLQSGMDATRPGQSVALQVGGGIVGSIPLAAAAGPSLMSYIPESMAAKMAATGIGGAIAGGGEGFVSGYGAGNDGDRMDMAKSRGKIGAGVGAGVAIGLPLVSKGVSSLFTRLRGRDVATIARELRISTSAAKVVRNAIENDDLTAAYKAIRAAGGDAMLADSGHATKGLLDAAIATGGAAGRIGREAVETRATKAATETMAVLDDVLGPIKGQKELIEGIRTGSSAARSSAYNAAYAVPIDYSASRGRFLEHLIKRLPRSAINRANELMRTEGLQSLQIIAKPDGKGGFKLERLPDVRRWDYITRGLRDVAEEASGKGKLGGTTDVGRAYLGLAGTIRKTLRGMVPEYGVALDTAADAISERNAVDLGYSLLRAGTRREDVALALKGASLAEKAAAKSGVRSFIDDTLANVKSVASDPNTDIRELRKIVAEMSSRSSREKMAVLLGPTEAGRLSDAMDSALMTLDLRAAIAANSKTAIRQSIQGTVKDVTSPGALGVLAQGKPAEFSKRLVQVFTGQSPEAVALRQQGIFEEIATALTGIKGPDAQRALAMITRAMNGQPIRDAEAKYLGRVVSSAIGLGAYQTETRLLNSR